MSILQMSQLLLLLHLFQRLQILEEAAPAQEQADQVDRHPAEDNAIASDHVLHGIGGY